MGKECVVVGCCNRDTDKQTGLKFHRVPKDEPRRTKWLRAINRKNQLTGEIWQPGDEGARVCSDHFIQGKNDDPNSPDYVPSVNLGYSTPPKTLDRYERVTKRRARKTQRKQDLEAYPEYDMASEVIAEVLETQSSDDREKIEPLIETLQKLVDKLNVEKKQVEKELMRTIQLNKELTDSRLKFRARHLKTDDEIKFYTGLPTQACFNWLVNFVMDVLPSSSMLCPGDIVLLVFMKLRLNSPNKDIGFRFGVSDSSVSNYLDTSIPAIAEKLKFLIQWHDKDVILKNRPQCFKDSYPHCISIIDCTEVFIECPSNFTARSATYSSYKHSNTIKYLVSITPAGSVSFISRAYAGKTSDKILTQSCGFLNFLSHGDLVLADRGFLIHDELA